MRGLKGMINRLPVDVVWHMILDTLAEVPPGVEFTHSSFFHHYFKPRYPDTFSGWGAYIPLIERLSHDGGPLVRRRQNGKPRGTWVYRLRRTAQERSEG